jgi:pilus assembly protein CpaC
MRARTLVPALLALLAVPAVALAADKADKDADGDADVIQVDVSGSRHVVLGSPISRVSVGAADVADVAAFPPDQLLITGKRLGQTTVAVWTKSDQVQIITIDVTYPTAAMTSALSKAFPDGKDLSVTAAGAALVITGQVTDPADVDKAEQIVGGYAAAASNGQTVQIVNSLEVPGDYQVQLEVSFAEVSRTALKEMGINFWQKAKNGDYVGGIVSPTSSQSGLVPTMGDQATAGQLGLADGLPAIATPMSGAFGVVFATAVGSKFPFSAALSVLSNRGYARTLSEPTLVAMSGQEATFLAGGEFPIPLPQSLGQIGVEYKKFGVQLKFTPTVVGDTIQLQLAATVSDIDFNLGVKLASVTVPGLTERQSATTVRLKDGQSFAIAGLLSDRVRSAVDKVPVLGDIPVLGALFRSTSYRREETELLVVVTAHIVRPTDDKPRLPGEDTMTDPSDLELFFMGTIESQDGHDADRDRPAAPSKKKQHKPAGAVGFKR